MDASRTRVNLQNPLLFFNHQRKLVKSFFEIELTCSWSSTHMWFKYSKRSCPLFRHSNDYNGMIIILFKTEFPFLEIRSEPLGQHLPKVKGSTQEGPLPFMPGRLKSNINIWRRTTNDSFVLSVIQHGYRIQWKDSIPPSQNEQKNSKNCLKHIDFITKSVEEALN